MGETLECAVIGLGRVASTFEDDGNREKPASHAGAIAANRRCRLAGGYDTDPGAAREFSRRWGGVRTDFSSAEELLTVTRPHVLVIATHPDSHYYYLRLAEKHAVRVVICEKPLAPNIRQSAKIVRLAHRQQSPIIVTNHERRYSTDWISVQKDIAAQKYGRLLSFHATLYFGVTTPLRAMLWHDGCHLVDILRFVFSASLCVGRVACKGALASQTAHISTRLRGGGEADGTPGIITAGNGRDHLVFELHCSFARGAITIGNGTYRHYRSISSPHYQGYRSLDIEQEGFDGPTGYFTNMLSDAVHCADGAGVPHASAAEAHQALRTVAAINRKLPRRRRYH